MEKRRTEQRWAKVELRERLDELPEITGLAAVYYDGTRATEFQLWEGLVERIMPGAFTRAIEERDDVRALFNHNPDYLLGRRRAKTLKLEDGKDGLRFAISPPETPIAAQVIESIRRGDLSGASFAFDVTDQQFRTEDEIDIREIAGVRLFDVGPVTYPAYEATTAETNSLESYVKRNGEEPWIAEYRAWKAEHLAEQAVQANRLRGYRKRSVQVALDTRRRAGNN